MKQPPSIVYNNQLLPLHLAKETICRKKGMRSLFPQTSDSLWMLLAQVNFFTSMATFKGETPIGQGYSKYAAMRTHAHAHTRAHARTRTPHVNHLPRNMTWNLPSNGKNDQVQNFNFEIMRQTCFYLCDHLLLFFHRHNFADEFAVDKLSC